MDRSLAKRRRTKKVVGKKAIPKKAQPKRCEDRTGMQNESKDDRVYLVEWVGLEHREKRRLDWGQPACRCVSQHSQAQSSKLLPSASPSAPLLKESPNHKTQGASQILAQCTQEPLISSSELNTINKRSKDGDLQLTQQESPMRVQAVKIARTHRVEFLLLSTVTWKTTGHESSSTGFLSPLIIPRPFF